MARTGWPRAIGAPTVSELVAVKGAPEEVLQRSTLILGLNGHPRRLTPKLRREILTANARMADQAMRVLGLAFSEPADGASPHDDLTWVGLVGMADPIRPGVRESIAACQRAGMRIVMLTGDQSGTAIAVGRALGLERNGSLRVAEATQLSDLTPEALRGLAGEVDIFARVSPAHKYQVVKALQASGEVVAMTGDGINDGPALRVADIGVAMGASGTDVARDLGDVVLLDDNLTSLVAAIEQGRTTHTNVRKALNFLLATNLSEILVTVGAIALGVARPLSAVQFLWINLLSDVVPALALAVEPPERDVMLQEPRDRDASILSGRTLLGVGRDAAILAAATLGAYGIAAARYGVGAQASTVAFATLTTSQLLHALTCRSETRSGFADLRQNPLMMGALGGTLALQVASVTVPALQRLLGTTPLGLADWAVVAAGATAPLAAREIGEGGKSPARREDSRVSKRNVFTSESVTRGHPDKICDQISDAVVDAFLYLDPDAQVSAECAVATGLVFLAVTSLSSVSVDTAEVARKVIRDIGYTEAQGFDPENASVITSLAQRTPHGGRSVVGDADNELDAMVASDQASVFGYACTHTPERMPLPIALAHRLARRLDEVRRTKALSYLGPDGKTLVAVEFEGRRPVRLHTVVISVQTSAGGKGREGRAELEDDIRKAVLGPVLDEAASSSDARTPLREPGRPLRGGRPPARRRAHRPQEHRSTPMGATAGMAAGPCRARTRTTSTGWGPMPRATWRATSWPPACAASARCTWPTPSARPSP